MQSEQINLLAESLSKAQGKITGALKDSANPFYKSRYADLASCWDACRQQLSDNGLAVIQTTEVVDGNLFVVTLLAHSSGQWVKGWTPVKMKDDGPQAQGSGITYARRYALAAIVGIAQIDDDAEAAQGRTETKKISPMPDPVALSEKDEATVQSFASSFADYLNADMDEGQMTDAIANLTAEVKEREDIYLEVWRRLDSKQRAAIKKFLNLANKRKAA